MGVAEEKTRKGVENRMILVDLNDELEASHLKIFDPLFSLHLAYQVLARDKLFLDDPRKYREEFKQIESPNHNYGLYKLYYDFEKQWFIDRFNGNAPASDIKYCFSPAIKTALINKRIEDIREVDSDAEDGYRYESSKPVKPLSEEETDHLREQAREGIPDISTKFTEEKER